MVAMERPLSGVRARPRCAFGGAVKRVFDVFIAVLALILLCPLFLALCLAVKLHDGGPIMFVQRRVGVDGAPFSFLKFRSMVPDASARLEQILAQDPAAAEEWREKQKLSNDPRMTPLGRVLRRSSLDELPQLLNVVVGDMSMVGPRPMLEQQVGEYGDAFPLYCGARPGITGLWQVSGRNRLTFHQRAQLDEVYLRRWSLMADLQLLARTAGVVLTGDGAG